MEILSDLPAPTWLLGATAAVLLADFASGVVHWAEDAYARQNTPIIGKWIGEANIEHHRKPRAFVSRGYWRSSWDLWLVSAAVVAGAWYMKLLTCSVWVFAVVAANANQVHKWAHRAPHENGRFITYLQKFKILQTQSHHGKHHRGEKNSYYCAITNLVNPVLEKIRFWKSIETVLERGFGLKRKPE